MERGKGTGEVNDERAQTQKDKKKKKGRKQHNRGQKRNKKKEGGRKGETVYKIVKLPRRASLAKAQ